MSHKIVVIGSSNVDFIMKAARLPDKGETVADATFVQAFGGKGANQAVAAARAGGDVWFVACIGDDPFAPALQEALLAAGVHVDYVFVRQGETTGAALVMIGEDGQNYIMVAPGANYSLKPDMIRSLEPLLREAALLVLQYEILPETLYACLDLAHALGLPVLFNLAPARPFDASYLPKTTYLAVNESEAQSLCGFAVDTPQAVERAAQALLDQGAPTVLLTLGAQGVYLASADLRQHIPAFEVEAVDTTAAGDVFCGALAAALVEGQPLPAAARFACAASAISVTRLGAQPSVPVREEIEQFLSAHQKICCVIV